MRRTSLSKSSVGMKVWSTAKGGRLSLPPHRAQGNTSIQLRSITMRPASGRGPHSRAGGVIRSNSGARLAVGLFFHHHEACKRQAPSQ